MSISAADVNKLRTMTGAGMMDCKKALTEANGDFEAAIDILRKKGQKVSASRFDKEAKEGAVFVKTSPDGKEGIVIALNCETDFVAKTDDFQKLGNAVVDLAFSKRPATVEALLAEKLDARPVSEHITDLVGKIGERVDIGAYEVVSGEAVVPYVHAGAKIGVLVSLKNSDGADVASVGKNVAMQIAAMKPVALDKDGVSQEVIDREMAIAREQILAEGKTGDMVDKIAQGKLTKFFKESTLLNQEFVMDSTKNVQQYLESVKKGMTVAEFKRISVSN
jgi:elongation factor Ts